MSTKENKNVDLLQGSIPIALTKLSIPIMATAFLQMAYNLIDMIWIGRVGSEAVSAVGVGSMFVWFANGIITIVKVGTQAKVGQHIGAGEDDRAASYAKAAFQLGIIAALIYAFIAVNFRENLIGFFQLDNADIARNAANYMMITCGLIVFYYMDQIFTGTWTALGNSKITLCATLVGLSINLVLDPVLIFGIGPFPELGVAGAASATVFAQFIVLIIFCIVCLREKRIFAKINKMYHLQIEEMKLIIRIGTPAGVQSMMFTSVSMILARFITSFGDSAIAVQKVGTQVESISWMTAEGFGTAVNAFTAQNYGAKQEKRINRGYRVAMTIMIIWGLITTTILLVFPGQIFQIFIKEEEMLQMGIDYLRIVGYSQLFMCMEFATAGAFQGLGKTIPPSVTGIILLLMRIPLEYVLCNTSLGLNGIWWAITISAIAKGIVLPIWFVSYRKKSKIK